MCKACGKSFTTNESSRQMSYARNRQKISEDMRKAVDEDGSLPEGKDLNMLLARMIVEGNASLRIIEMPSFKKFVAKLNVTYKLPTRHIQSNTYIPMLSNQAKKHFLDNLKLQSSPTLSIEFDHWTDVTRRSLLGVVATDADGSMFFCDLNEARKNTTQMIVESLRLEVKSMPPSSINSLISDSASSCASARASIVQIPEYKHVIQHRCIPHLLYRIG